MLNTFVVIAGLVASSFDDAPASLRLIKDFRGFGSLDPRTTRSLLDNNFESGSMSPWYDESPAYVTWRVEDIQTPTEADYPAPYPLSGFKYVRATRNADLLSGLAVLRSPLFTALPGDRITFDFWMRSKRPEGNSLEVIHKSKQLEMAHEGIKLFSRLACLDCWSERNCCNHPY